MKSHLELVEDGIDALTRWTEALGHDSMTELFKQVIPSWRSFLDGETLQLLEESTKYKIPGQGKKGLEIMEDASMDRIQRKIILFLGQISSDLHYLMLPTEEEMSNR